MTHDPLIGPWLDEIDGLGADAKGTTRIVVSPNQLQTLIVRVREDEHGKRDRVWDVGWEKGYAAALRDAVEAVKALRAKARQPMYDPGLEAAVAAIEGLSHAND